MTRHRLLTAVTFVLSASFSPAADWPQFRGPEGNGVSEAKNLPVTWSDTENVAWKAELPGKGTSSPVVFGERIYLTCWNGPVDALERHVLCLKLDDGSVVWKTAVKSELPEQAKIREDHGYASSTLAVDADRLYAFFGKSGVMAFDHEGKLLWKADVGSGLNGWGSASSPVLHGGHVLVNASVESESLVALDKKTGKEAWRAEGIKESWHTPVVAQAGGKPEIVLAMIQKVKGIDPATGDELWSADTGIPWYMCPTPVVNAGVAHVIGGRGGAGLAVRLGGKGNVTDSHVLHQLSRGTNVPSPILHDGHLFWANDNSNLVYCADAKTGKIVYEERMDPRLDQVYASPILAEGRVYYIGRGGRAAVVAAKPKFEVLGTGTLENGRGMFNASPAAVGDRLLIRSDKALYCLRKGK